MKKKESPEKKGGRTGFLLSRREFLAAISLGLGGAVGFDVVRNWNQYREIVLEGGLDEALFAEELSEYEEGLEVRERVRFESAGREFRFVNTSEVAKLNEGSLKDWVGYVESIGSELRGEPAFSTEDGGVLYLNSLLARGEVDDIRVFLIDNARWPDWAGGNQQDSRREVSGWRVGKVLAVVVKVGGGEGGDDLDFNHTRLGIVNGGLAYELCQGMLWASDEGVEVKYSDEEESWLVSVRSEGARG